MKKLRSKVGESIGETLVAILVMALAFLILTGGVATAARVNARAKNQNVAVGEGSAVEGTHKVKFAMTGLSGTKEAKVTLYETDNGYYYYDNVTFEP